MNERVGRLVTASRRVRTISPIDQLERYIGALSAGDRALTYLLITLIIGASVFGFFALERRILVNVPAYGGTLVEGALGSPRFVNPLLAISDADRDLTSLTYAGLMGLTSEGKLAPVLAESYSVSPDGKTYTFVISQNAVFSDGTPVTADDVVFTVQKAQDPGLKSPQFADWSGVEARALDSHTVEFVLPKSYAPFLENTTLGILPARLWRAIPNEQFPFSTLSIRPVGAGAFVVRDITRDSTGLITEYALSANNSFALGRPYLDRITIKFFAQQDDLVKALANGSVDSAYGLPLEDGRAAVLTAPYARVFGVFFNPSANSVYARAEVRKALSLAIDRDQIANEVLGGYASGIMGPVPPGGGVEVTLVPFLADPITEASKTLTDAGWAYDGATRTWKHANAKLTLEAITIKTSNVPELKAVGSAVKTDWEKLGIPVDIELYEPGDLNQNVIRPRKYEALLFGMVIGREADLYAFWHSSERNDPGLNIALYANKTVDALLEDARETSDLAKHISDLQKIEEAVAADYPAAFTHAPDFIYSVPSKLGGIRLPQITTPSDRFANVREWYLSTDAVWPIFVPTTNN